MKIKLKIYRLCNKQNHIIYKHYKPYHNKNKILIVVNNNNKTLFIFNLIILL